MLKSYNAKNNTFTLVNPYADGDSYWNPDGARTITLTWAQLSKWLHDYSYAGPPPSAN
jgi:hypothetical protein